MPRSALVRSRAAASRSVPRHLGGRGAALAAVGVAYQDALFRRCRDVQAGSAAPGHGDEPEIRQPLDQRAGKVRALAQEVDDLERRELLAASSAEAKAVSNTVISTPRRRMPSQSALARATFE
jgi:hypothetical protein